MKAFYGASLLVISHAFQGCATDYTCGAVPGSKCKNVNEVYEQTNEGVKDYRSSLYGESKEGSSRKAREVRDIAVAPSANALNYKSPGDPVLVKPEVMRILFTSWVDKENDLNAGGYVYLQLGELRWDLNESP